MPAITIRLFQAPHLLSDGQAVSLPFKKAEALLYYLAVKKSISREQASTLLWDTNDDQTARKNLRHTLYTIKKCFGQDLIIFPQKQILCLNPDIDFSIDYGQFLDKNKTELYEGQFLDDFTIKNANVFVEWLQEERLSLHEEYIRALYNQMLNLADDQVVTMEQLFSRYVKEDPLDERVYLLMMLCYQKNNLYHKGIKVYQNLSKLLNSELRIAPGKELSSLHKELLHSWTEAAVPEQETVPGIIGRNEEMDLLTKAYHSFLSGTPSAICLTGDNGVGKTFLMNYFLESMKDDSCLILRAICFQAEKDFIFQTWNSIMLQLDRYIQSKNLSVPSGYLTNIRNMFPLFCTQSAEIREAGDIATTYNYRAVRNSVLKLFTFLADSTPVILSFDNLQYMDSLSLELLSLLIREKNSNILIICTSLELPLPLLPGQIKSLYREKLLTPVPLRPFTQAEVEELVEAKLGAGAVSRQILDNIYQETEGNAFFLDMVLNIFTPGSPEKSKLFSHPYDILSDRIAALSKEARQVLDTLSICHNYSTLDILETVLNRDTLEIIDLLDELKNQGLIEEKTTDGQLKFRHNKMQDFVYSQLSPSKRRLLHARIGAYLEEHGHPRDGSWFQNLVYHFNLSGDEPRALKYKILNLEDYSRYNYELYPILHPRANPSMDTGKQLTEYFDELTEQLASLYHCQPDAVDFKELSARLYLLMGKYYISQGIYERGIWAINQILEHSDFIDTYPKLHIAFLRQMTFYGIQTWNTSLMRQYILKSMEIETSSHLHTDYAIECRLYGLYASMCGDYEEARTYLFDAIKRFQNTPLEGISYGLNIAACYNYLGEVERKQSHFEKSLDYFNQAIRICTERKCPQHPTFYGNKCRSLMALHRTAEAYDVLLVSNQLYDDTPIMVGRPIIKAYCSILKAVNGEMETAKVLYQEADTVAKALLSPMSLGVLAQAEAWMLRQYPHVFETIIGKNEAQCMDEASRCLSKLPGSYELHMPIESLLFS